MAVIETKEKKPRTPTLPAKFGKFIQFGYWLIQSFKDEGGNFAVDNEDEFIEAIHLYDSVDAQQEFVQDFFDESKELAKDIRKMILDKKRAEAKAAKAAAKAAEKAAAHPKEPKAPKEKVVKAPKEKVVKEPKEKVVKEPKEKVVKAPKVKADETVEVAEEVLQPVVTEKPKKGKAKKVVDDQFVAEVVSLANATTTTTAPAQEPLADKPKRKYNKKDKGATTAPTPLLALDDQPEISVSVVDIDGTQFLLDDDNRLFDFDSHLHLGFLVDGILKPLST
jgi:outer membrane biosynthesis protein TonB